VKDRALQNRQSSSVNWQTRIHLSELDFECSVSILQEANKFRTIVLSKISSTSSQKEIDKVTPATTTAEAEPLQVKGDFFVNDKDIKQVALSKPLILIVEDDVDQRSIVEMVLKESDYEVLTASDGIEALRVLGRSRPDLIISDLMMPNLDGAEFVKRLKSDKRFNSIPVLILTVINDMEKEFHLLSLGVDDYCEKTVQRKILLKRIENLLKRTRG
jgi:CheY-like chemotaxis protein